MKSKQVTKPALNILVVCSGNTCRSPVAAIFLKALLSRHTKVRYDVRSAGFKPIPGQPIWHIAHPGIDAASERLGLNLSEVRAQVLAHKSRSLRAVIGPRSADRFVPDTILFMEQEKLAPIREGLATVLPTEAEPNWVLLNVRDHAYNKWEASGYPAESGEPGYEECEREYSRLCTALERRSTYLSSAPQLLETSSSPFSLH